MGKNKVSVIIPTFERYDTLKRAILSVLNQTLTDFEIVIVNDSPNEKEVLDLISHINDNRIKYFRNSREKGGNGARNTGILNSECRYIAFLDDDDEWLHNKLHEQYNVLVKSNDDIGGVLSGFERLEGSIWKIYDQFNFPDDETKKKVIIQEVSVCAGSNLMIKRDALDVSGLFDESLERHQDLEFIVRVMRSHRLKFINKIGLKVYPSGRENPFLLEKAFAPFIKRIMTEIKELTKEERKKLFAHKYYTLAKLFADESETLKTVQYCLKLMRVRIVNPLTIFTFILKSMRAKSIS